MGVEYLVHLAVPDPRRKAMWAIGMWVARRWGWRWLLSRAYRVKGATQYLAGYALEQAMSLDNLFVFLLLFRLFRIPAGKQPKVLFWGVAGAIVLRGVFIAGGVGLLNRFHWVEYVFGALLLVAAVRLLKPEDGGGDGAGSGVDEVADEVAADQREPGSFFCRGKWAADGYRDAAGAGGGGVDRCGVCAGFDPGGVEYYAGCRFWRTRRILWR